MSRDRDTQPVIRVEAIETDAELRKRVLYVACGPRDSEILRHRIETADFDALNRIAEEYGLRRRERK